MGNVPRHFRLIRDDDVSGISGEGHVADIAVFSDGHAALHWLGRWPLTTPHPEGMASIEGIHGHGGATRIVPVGKQHTDDEWAISLLSDLDRCQHGRHHGDECGSCGTYSLGNPYFRPGEIIGYGRYGDPIVMPERDRKYNEQAWRSAK